MALAILLTAHNGWVNARNGENTSVALITKTIQTVTKKTAVSDWTTAGKGDPLASGDQVQTGKKSLAVVKFIDNSIVRVREQSELTIVGEMSSPRTFSKEIQMKSGALGFDIKKQKQNEQFKFTSPTSVASIRGTSGGIKNGVLGDTEITFTNLVNLKNQISNKDIDIPAGWIGFSYPDGSISSRQATEEELAEAHSLINGGAGNDIRLELQDSKGNKKELRIKTKQ